MSLWCLSCKLDLKCYISRRLWRTLLHTKAYLNNVAKEKNRLHVNHDVLHFFKETFEVTESTVETILKRVPRLKFVDEEHMISVLNELKKFNIDKESALNNPAVFVPNSKSTRNHGNILQECGFLEIKPRHLITYNTLVKKTTVEKLKNTNLLPKDINVYEKLSTCFSNFPCEYNTVQMSNIENSSLYDLRILVIQKYLEWRLSIKKEDFLKINQIYYHFRHRPLKDIQTSISIALDEIEIPKKKILSYPYVISADPYNTLKILNEVGDFDGVDAREVLRIAPGVIKTDYRSIMKIKKIIQEHRIPVPIQKRGYLIYTLKPETVQSRLNELKNHKVFNALSCTNRALLLVLYKNRMTDRIKRLENLNKKCTRLQHLLSSNDYFEHFARKFGDRSGPKDIVQVFIGMLLPSKIDLVKEEKIPIEKKIKEILSKHCFWTCIPITSLVDTIQHLLKDFTREDILLNPHIIFYSSDIIRRHLNPLKELRDQCIMDGNSNNKKSHENDKNYDFKLTTKICANNVDIKKITNNQVLGLVLYSIEQEHLFTGDGIWIDQMPPPKDNQQDFIDKHDL